MFDNTKIELTTISIDDFVDVVVNDSNLPITLGHIIESNGFFFDQCFPTDNDYVEIGMMGPTDKPILVKLLTELFGKSEIYIDEEEYLEMVSISKNWNQMCKGLGDKLTMRMCDNFFDTFQPILNSKMKKIIDRGVGLDVR